MAHRWRGVRTLDDDDVGLARRLDASDARPVSGDGRRAVIGFAEADGNCSLRCDDEPMDLPDPEPAEPAPFALVMADAAGRIVYWDHGAAEFFGRAPKDAIGQPVDIIVPDDQRDGHWQGFRRVMAGGERHLVGAAINLPVRLVDGTVLAFPARFVHLADANDEMIGAAAVFSARRGDETPWSPIN